MVLDGGAAGIIAPYVETVEQVRALRGAVKLRPIKGQRLQRIIDGEEPEPELAAYMESHASKRALIVNIESVPAMDALDDILAEPGLDAVLIGPHDLSCSLGIPEQWDHPRFLAACENIFRRARTAKIGAGIHFWGSASQQARFLNFGANLLIHSADISLFQKHLTLELAEIRANAGIAITNANSATAII
jgi:4-hydroxy-2-oxoheptanedioate aldolase